MKNTRSSESLAREEALDRMILERPPGLLTALQDALGDDDPEVRSTAAYGLGELDDLAAVPLLIQAVDHDADDSVAEHALKAMETYSTPTIAEALRRETRRLRRHRAPLRMAALQLARYDSDETVAALLRLLSSSDVAVRDAALESLDALRPSEHARWLSTYLES